MKTFTFLTIILLFSLAALSQTTLGTDSNAPVQINVCEGTTELLCLYQLEQDDDIFQPSCSRNYSGKNVYFSFILPESGSIKLEVLHKSVVDHGIALYTITGSEWTELACSQVISKNSEVVISDSALAGHTITGRIWINSGSDSGSFILKSGDDQDGYAAKVPVIGVLSATPEELVNNVLISGCVQANNIQFTGHPESIGFFTNGTPGLDFSSGLILSTGKVTKVAGPNNSPATCTNLQQPGDSLLTALIHRQTYDAAILEFDFIPATNTISFQYAFGSEEYEEYVGGVFNDIFTFYISGGPEGYNNQNIALIPGTNTPVSINNVNHMQNTEWYYNNDNGQHLQFDGMTRTLTAFASVTPCETYHIRLAIADAADPIFDSGVFLKAGSFNSGTIPLVKNITDWVMVNTTYEGCSNSLTFARSDNNNIDEPLDFNIEIGGTAVPGIDYSTIPLDLQIPAGEEFLVVPYDVFTDGVTEGGETISIKIFTGCECGLAFIEETINVYDNIEITGSISNNGPQCAGDSVLINLDIDQLPENYEIIWSTGQTGSSMIYATLEESQNVSAEVLYPCGSEIFTTWVDILPLPQANVYTNAPVCAGQDLEFSAENGISYLWKGPSGWFNSESSPVIENAGSVRSGIYGVTVTGENGCEYKEIIDVQIHDWPVPQLPENVTLCERDNISLSPGEFYQYLWTGPGNWESDQNSLSINNIIIPNSGNYYLTVSDDIGCTGAATVEISVNPSPVANVNYNYPVCSGGNLLLSGTAEGQVWWTGPASFYSENPVEEIVNVNEQNSGYYGFYAINEFNCKDSVISFIGVTIPDASITGSLQYCSNQNNVTLHSLYSGGVWSGTGIINPDTGTFSPYLAGSGDHIITYHIGYDGCEDTQTAIISVDEAPVILLNNPSELCNNEGPVVLDAGTEGVIWTGNGITNAQEGIFDPLISGTGNAIINYSVTQGACTITGTDSIEVHQGVDASISPVDRICENHAPFWLNAASPGGIWQGTGIVNMITGKFNPSVAGPGTHRIYYFLNNSDCEDMDSVDIVVDPYIPANIGNDLNFCINDQDVVLSSQNQGGEWSGYGVSSDGLFSPASSGVGTGQVIYTITNGECSSSDTISVSVYDFVSAEFTSPAQICEFENPYEFSAQNPGGIWSGSGITNSVSGMFSPSVAGEGVSEISYTIINQACINTVTKPIEVLDAPDPGFLSPLMFCVNEPDVQLQSITSGGVWNGDGITDNSLGIFSPALAGTGPSLVSYSVSNAECTSVSSRYLWVYDGSEEIIFNTPEIVCENENEFILHAEPEGGVWSGPGVYQDSLFNPEITGNGQYYLTYTIGSGLCAVSDSVNITVSALPQVILLSDSEYCSNSSQVLLTANPDGGFWTGDAVNDGYFVPENANTGNNIVYYNLNDGICQSTYEFNINVFPYTQVEISGIEPSYCQNYGSVVAELYPSGGNISGTELSPVNSFQTSDLSIGINSITYSFTNDFGCTSEETVSFEILEVPEVIVSGIATDYCKNSNDISFHATPWGGNVNGIEISGNTFSPTTTGIGEHFFSYSYTAPNGCSDSYYQSVFIHGLPEISFEILNYPSCAYSEDAEIRAIVSDESGYEIIWDNGLVTNSDILSGVGAGWHTVEIINEFDCIIYDSVYIEAPEELSVSISGTLNLPCYNSENGMLNAVVSGGTGPYSYLWNAGENPYLPNISGLGTGEYYLTVTDSNLCQIIAGQAISQAEETSYQIEKSDALNCFGDDNGFINISTYDPELSIIWDDGNSLFERSNLSAGTYMFTITNAGNCQIIDTVEIEENTEIFVQEEITFVNCGNNLGSIFTNTSGGVGPYSFLWSTEDENSVLSEVPAGIYQLTVQDVNLCTKTYSYTIEATDSIDAFIDIVSGIDCFGNNSGVVSAISPDGILPLTYVWSDGTQSNSLSDIYSGEYYVLISDAQGCTGHASVVLSEPDELVIHADIEDVKCKGENTGYIILSTEGGTGTIDYLWQDGTSQQYLTDLYAGTYTFTATDANNCKIVKNISINEPQNPLDYTLTGHDPKCWGSADGYLSSQASGGTEPYTYLWKYDGYTIFGKDISDLYAGIYKLEITDSNNCKVTAQTELEQPAAIEFNTSAFPVSCDGNNDGWFIINATGGIPPYSYGDGEDVFSENEITGKFPGIYSAYVIDNNGCVSGMQQVIIPRSEEECLIIPNAFTPNNDGVNDKWEIENIDIFPDASVQVFNRWGQIVFETVSDNEIWDGTYLGDLHSGTYVYIIDPNNGSASKTGTISLVR